jgi:hypothetical protein
MIAPQNTRYLELDEQIIMKKALYKSARLLQCKYFIKHPKAELVERRIKDE